MAHPLMFDEKDPMLAKVRNIALSFPGAAEKVSHGRPVFFTKKIFTYFSSSVRSVDGVWTQHEHSIVVLLDAEDRQALANDPRFFVPAYFGTSGWLGIDLTKKTDWSEIRELIDSSYRQTAPPKLITELDG